MISAKISRKIGKYGMCAEAVGPSEGPIGAVDLAALLPDVPVKEELVIKEIKPKVEASLTVGEELKIILTEGGTKSHVLKVMHTLFGKTLVDRVAQSIDCQKWPQKLGKEDVLTLMGAIGHSVTLDDLEQCFAELKAGDMSREILKHSQIPYLRMWWAGTAQQLPTYWFNHLLEMFRNPIQIIDPESDFHLGAALMESDVYKERCLSYTYHDYAVKKLMLEGDRTRPEFFISPREQLAKFVAYATPESAENGMLVPVFNQETSQLDYYQLTNQIHHKGLNGYFFTPIDSSTNLPAQLIFRGTNCAASAHRDLDPYGVGKTTFDEKAAQIQAMVATYAKKHENAKIEVIGHSLGAADAQRAVINLISPDSDFSYADIKLYTYCTPKLDSPTINMWFQNLSALCEAEKKPRIEFSFSHHERDLVTWTGDANICGTEEFFIPCSYLVVKSDSGVADIALHHTAPFFEYGNFNFTIDNRTFEFYQSFAEDELQDCIRRLEEIENTNSWYLTIKSHFVHVDSAEDLRNRIEKLKAEQERLKELDKECPYRSWLLWTATRAFNYTLQPIVYSIWGWLYGVHEEAEATAE